MTVTMPPICVACKHFEGWAEGRLGGYCTAYPKGTKGIPRTILLSEVDHRQAAPGDHGVRFEPKSKADARYPDLVFSGPTGQSVPLSTTLSVAPERPSEPKGKAHAKE